MHPSRFVALSFVSSVCLALAGASACSASDSGADSTTDAASSYGGAGGGTGAAGAGGAVGAQKQVTAMVGPQGGVVQVEGATLTFAPGALPTMTSITLTATDEPAPAGHKALSKVFQCEPSGLDFPEGVTMQLSFTPDGAAASMFWSSAANPSFTDIGGTVDGSQITATIKHFSKGFVGRKL